MTHFRLGINNCFAVKRWPEPERWAAIVRDRLGLDLVQHCLDLADLTGSTRQRAADAANVRAACTEAGITLHSTFTGLGVYTSNMLLDPQPRRRASAEAWYRHAIEFSSQAGAAGIGGYVGAYSATDWQDQARRRELGVGLRARLHRLAGVAHRAGLSTFYVENLALVREPSTMDALLGLMAEGDSNHVPLKLCLDVGHMCVPGAEGAERDPYAWLRRLGLHAPMVHLQQSDANNDRHWPFTPETNLLGQVDALRVIDALADSGAADVTLILEIVPPFLKDDNAVLEELAASVAYWHEALAAR